MVKGITKQVIVVHSPDPKLFEQAIFILKDDAISEGVTDEMLLKEAKRVVHQPQFSKKSPAPLWACMGAGATALLWLISNLL